MEKTLDTKYKKRQLLRVEIKSEALFREGKKSFVTYFQGGSDRMIVHDCQKLYPQFTADEDHPVIEITPISKAQYLMDLNTKRVNAKGQVIATRANVMQPEDYEDETLAS